MVEESTTKLQELDISGRVNCDRILESLSVTAAEECRNTYQLVMTARSKLGISGDLEHEHVGIERKRHDDKV